MLDLTHPIGLSLSLNISFIKEMGKVLRRRRISKLGLVCTGSSGAIIAGIVASMFKTTPVIIYIRKKGEKGHFHDNISAIKKLKNLVFIDDFISSGETVNYVVSQLQNMGIQEIKGICLVNEYGLDRLKNKTFFQEFYIPKKR